jgi:dUTP pyrophosphatase
MTAAIALPVFRLAHALDLPLPDYQTADAAGLDLMAALGPDGSVTLGPLDRALVPTGLVFQIPQGYEGQVRPRSGLAVKNGITVLNAPGTIDSDYRGEIKVPLVNLGAEPFTVVHGMRIAQIVFAAVTRVEPMEVVSVDETARGTGGFGSTGVHGG